MKLTKNIAEGMILRIDSYKAQTVKKYDKTPTALVLRASKTRCLCFNINWLSKSDKKKLYKFLEDQLKAGTLNSKVKRISFFRKLRLKSYTRSCYRVYVKAGYQGAKIYQMTIDEFKSAVNGDYMTYVDETKLSKKDLEKLERQKEHAKAKSLEPKKKGLFTKRKNAKGTNRGTNAQKIGNRK